VKNSSQQAAAPTMEDPTKLCTSYVLDFGSTLKTTLFAATLEHDKQPFSNKLLERCGLGTGTQWRNLEISQQPRQIARHVKQTYAQNVRARNIKARHIKAGRCPALM
jgi:hypothetical protein